jgi:transcriptional regulator with XRE-family HTH domain
VESKLDPRQILARRLRELREASWPDMKVTQPQLARAMGGDRSLSVALISSWESRTNPKIPPIPRLEAYATFFATPRSVDGPVPRLLNLSELTDEEQDVRGYLERELLHLRGAAMHSADTSALRSIGVGSPGVAEADQLTEADQLAEALNEGLWRFGDGRPVTIVCAQLPAELLARMPYSDPADPTRLGLDEFAADQTSEYIALYTYADLDALFELYGHVRAANPISQVNLRAANQLKPDDYTTHLVALGGTDWNVATKAVLDRFGLPVRQVADWDSPEGPYFEVGEGTSAIRHHPRVDWSGEQKILREDVALFSRGPNPYNRRRTVTLCSGMHGSGSYGAVRALTDARFRDRNGEYVRSRFGDSQPFCILTRVTVENGIPLTPDWTEPTNRLFEWSAEQP